MKQIIKYFLILVSLSFFIVIGGVVNYAMPSYDETYVTGMEVIKKILKPRKKLVI